MMLANFFSVLLATVFMASLAWGLARPLDGTDAGRVHSILWGVLAPVLMGAAVWNRDFTTMAIGSAIYYPVPLPHVGILNQVSLLLTFAATPLLFYPLGRALGARMHDGGAPSTSLSLYLAGLAAGASAVYVGGTLGPLTWILVGFVLWSFLILAPKRAAACAVVVVLVFGAYHANPRRSFFTWGISDYQYLSGGFGRDVKYDFLAFNNDECLGVVIDNVMMTCECKDPSWIPIEYDYIVRSLLYPYSSDPYPPKPGDPAWRRDLKVLDIGRSGGGNSRALEIHSGPNQNAALEFEPAIGVPLLDDFHRYNRGIYRRPNARVMMGDYRTNMAELIKEERRFDFVFYSGIGTKTYILPLSYMFVEQFILTKEAMSLVFDKLLEPDGVFVLDWGTSDTRESQYFIGGIPTDVAKVVYWTTQSQFPFAGSPQVYVIASRDRSRIEAIRTRLDRMTDFIRVEDAEDLPWYATTDNKPLLQPDLHISITAFHAFLLVPFAFLLVHFRRNLRTPGDWAERGISLAAIAGFLMGFLESLYAAYNPMVRGLSGIPSWSVMHMAFLWGSAVGAAYTSTRPSPSHSTRCAAGMTIAGLAGLTVLRGFHAILASAPLAGMGAGALAAIVFSDERRVPYRAFAAFVMGVAAAYWLFRFPFFFGGYQGVAAIAAIIALALAARLGASKTRSAQRARQQTEDGVRR